MKAVGLAMLAGVLLAAQAAQDGDEAALKKERSALVGMWKIASFEAPTGKIDKFDGAILEFDADGKNLTFQHNGETKKFTFKLNPAGKPKEIDIVDPTKTFEGIYAIEKTTLKLCLSPERGEGRPNEFAVKEGKQFVLITLEKSN